MTKLKKYNTIEEWEAAKIDGNIPYPGVGLIVEDGSVAFMKQPIHTLPIKAVFYDSATGSFVKMYPDEITEAIPTYTPIGVEVVPAEHDVYGTGQAGIMSLANMSCDTPDTGISTFKYIRYGGRTVDTSIPNYRWVNYIGYGGNLNNGVVQGAATGAYLPSDMFTDVTGIDGKSNYNLSSDSYQAPSPFHSNGSRNEAYYTIAYNTANVLSDFDGVGNTKVLTDLATAQSDWKTATTITNPSSNSVGYYPAACCTWRFHTSGTDQGQWYLPAMGELGYVVNRISAINNTINKIISVYPSAVAIKVDTLNGYLSSSEASADYKWSLWMASGVIGSGSKDVDSLARAFLRI